MHFRLKPFISFQPASLWLLLLAAGTMASVDEYMTCDRLMEGSKQREARVLEQIPCDMAKVSFCQHKGTSYPE